MWLRITSGPDAGHSFEVGAEATLGRERGVDVIIRDERASRRHAVIKPSPDGLHIRDLGSANGTHFDGARVEEATVRAGERFCIADTEIEVLKSPPSVQSRLTPSEAAKRAAAAALADAARAARETRPPDEARTESAPPPPTYSMVGQLIEERTRGQRRVTYAAVAIAVLALILVAVLLLGGDPGA